MNFKDKHILILAPHTDDGELGCGGTIARALEEGAKVHYMAFSTVEQSVPSGYPSDQLEIELKEATRRLGIQEHDLTIMKFEVRKLNYVRQELLEILVDYRKMNHVDIVFMPCQHDIHQDHSTVAAEGLRAFKQCTILGYELLWNNLSFETDVFIKLTKAHVDKKIEALSAYESQQHRNYMTANFQHSLAHVRGVQIGEDYAEAFQLIRWIF